jgi:glycosyltransferase involved in cell wall biosynthesis
VTAGHDTRRTPRSPWTSAAAAHRRPLAVIAPVHPQVSGGAQFNTVLVAALAELGPVEALSWRRLYPPLLHRRDAEDRVSRPTRSVHAEALLDWADPRTWRRAAARIAAVRARAVVLPWIHPVMAPPYRWLLRHLPADARRVMICHNVEPHEPVPLGAQLTRAVLRHADLLVLHASHQVAELAELGLADRPVLQAFHPRFPAGELCARPTPEQVAAERARQGDPGLSLLAFGAIRPYKGIDLALEALARVPPELRARLTVAGVFWDGGDALRRRARELGVEDRVELRNGFVSNEEAAVLFSAADACLLPYRSATQSGVLQLSFAYGVPAIATAVGGLPEALTDGVDGILCPPEDVGALAAAVRRMASQRDAFAAGVRRIDEQQSFTRYGQLLHDALDDLPDRREGAVR